MRLKRHIEPKLLKMLANFPVVVLLGARQVGKTTLCRGLKPDWRYIDLERADNYTLLTSDPRLFLEQNPNNVIFDEAQLAPELFSELRGVIDEDRRQKGRYLLTGSSSPELNRHVTQTLAGRAAILELGTLKTTEQQKADLSKFYELFSEPQADFSVCGCPLTHGDTMNHWFAGGYPELQTAERDLWYEQYVKQYVERDIRALFPGINIQRYRKFVQLLASLSGKLVNKSNIAQVLDISDPTANDYLQIATGSFFWRHLSSYERTVTKEIAKMPKGHLRDSGLCNTLLKISSLEQLQVHPDMGNLFEAFVVEEVLKGLSCSSLTMWSAHHYRTRGRTEIDLIIDTSNGPVPIEVKYHTRIDRKVVNTLRNFVKENNSPHGFLINNSDRVELLADKVFQMPLRAI